MNRTARYTIGPGVLGLLLSGILGCASPEHASDSGENHHAATDGGATDGDATDGATVHHRFDDPERWADRFEDPSRDAWQEPERVLQAMELTVSSRVADIGAATGYFPVRIAPRVPEGVVYGVDIEPTLVNYLNVRAHRAGLTNLVGLVCEPQDPRIPEPVDVVLVCNTYHHIDMRVDYFERLRGSLRPGGRLMIVDFRKGEFPVGPSDEHKLPATQVIDELGRAGYRIADQFELQYQYVLVFRCSSGPE